MGAEAQDLSHHMVLSLSVVRELHRNWGSWNTNQYPYGCRHCRPAKPLCWPFNIFKFTIFSGKIKIAIDEGTQG